MERTLERRVTVHAAAWGVNIERTLETTTSVIAFGRRDDEPVVLKVVRSPRDEWDAGEVLRAFDGRGMVRALAFAPGAMLLEQLQPGHSLIDLVTAGRDDEATDIIASVIRAMDSVAPLASCPTVAAWGLAFDRYLRGVVRPLPYGLVVRGHEMYQRLASSQTRIRLLHGDLQHSNVLFDAARGWVAIDPKGVIGEPEYEIGPMLRNPSSRRDLCATPAIIERRVHRLAATLGLDAQRILAWGFAQSALSAIWNVEDGLADTGVEDVSLLVAQAILPLLS
jgi:streptomycin 6-kinase